MNVKSSKWYCRERERGEFECKEQCQYCQKQDKEYKAIGADAAEEAFASGNVKAFEKEDLINKPNHYHKGGIDIYEIAQMKFTPEEYRGFCKGNMLKYLLREDMKGGVEDIKKLRFNADRLIENMEGKPYVPEYKKKSEGVKGQ